MAGSTNSFVMSYPFPTKPPVTSPNACYVAGLQLGLLLFPSCFDRNERTTVFDSCNQSWMKKETAGTEQENCCGAWSLTQGFLYLRSPPPVLGSLAEAIRHQLMELQSPPALPKSPPLAPDLFLKDTAFLYYLFPQNVN